MSATAATLVGWLEAWPPSTDLGRALAALAGALGQQTAVVTGAPHSPATMPADAPRLRASYDECRRANRVLDVRLGSTRVRLGPTAGAVQRGRVELELTLPDGSLGGGATVDLITALRVQFGIVRRDRDAPTDVFRAAGLTAVGRPTGESAARGGFEWWSCSDGEDAARWLKHVARHMLTGEPVTGADEARAVRPSGVQGLVEPTIAASPGHAMPLPDAGDVTIVPRSAGAADGQTSRRAPLPFTGTTSPARLAALRGVAAPEQDVPGAAVPAGEADGDSTMMLPRAALLGQLSAPAFVAALATVSFPDLSVDRYAALTAELEAKGATPELLRRYELPTEASLRALKAEMERRFASDPALDSRFRERVRHFLGFLLPKDGLR